MSQENYDSAGNENQGGKYLGDGHFENDPPVPHEGGGEWVCSMQELEENFKWFLEHLGLT